jgi:hypothetical protein
LKFGVITPLRFGWKIRGHGHPKAIEHSAKCVVRLFFGPIAFGNLGVQFLDGINRLHRVLLAASEEGNCHVLYLPKIGNPEKADLLNPREGHRFWDFASCAACHTSRQRIA